MSVARFYCAGMNLSSSLLLSNIASLYRENGYIVLGNFFSPEYCDTLLTLFEFFADKDFSAVMNLDRVVLRVQEDVVKNRELVAVLEGCAGAELCALMSQVLFKKAKSLYASQAWNSHQDNSYPKAEAGAYITINLFLRDADKENGCLYIYPGTHTRGLLPFEPVMSFRETPGTNPGNKVIVPPEYEDKKVDLVVKKGDVLILHGNTIHGSYPNVSLDRDRPLFSVSYIKLGVPFWPGDPKRSDKKVIRLH